METILTLLRTAALAVIGFFIALGSFFTGTTGTVVVLSPVSTTTPSSLSTTTDTAATSTIKTSVAAKGSTPTKVVAQKSGLPGTAKQGAGIGDPRTFVAAPLPKYSTEELNTLARAALVNILCTTASGGSFNPISGSGVIVDSRGIILTNAHVAQYFLLHDYPTAGSLNCVIRVGSPAQPRYTAELMYLPPEWIADNASKIKDDTPTGTGENDYAFLLITGTTDPNAALPSSFASLGADLSDPQPGDQMLLAAYPAGFLGGIAISLNLYLTSAIATVGKVYTFNDSANTDLFSLGGTVVSQSGSSGGAVVSMQGKLVGLIATEVPADTTAGRDLRAITLSHIDRSLRADNLGGITALLSQNPTAVASAFATQLAPTETKALLTVLNKQ